MKWLSSGIEKEKNNSYISYNQSNCCSWIRRFIHTTNISGYLTSIHEAIETQTLKNRSQSVFLIELANGELEIIENHLLSIFISENKSYLIHEKAGKKESSELSTASIQIENFGRVYYEAYCCPCFARKTVISMRCCDTALFH